MPTQANVPSPGYPTDVWQHDQRYTGPSEPRIRVGLIAGAKEFHLTTAAPTALLLGTTSGAKSLHVPEATRITLRLGVARAAAKKQAYVTWGPAIPAKDAARLGRAVLRASQQAHGTVEAVGPGALLHLKGRELDTRVLRPAIRADSQETARLLATRIARETHQAAHTEMRPAERPHGELIVEVQGRGSFRAEDGVRLIPQAPQEKTRVEAVPYGRGYAWAGQATRHYRGALFATLDGEGMLALVNLIDIETLLEGVVPAEMFASAPPAALEAQAIAARNMIVSQLGHRHLGSPYDLCADQHCQVYGGVEAEAAATTAAVKRTRGQALFLNGTLVDARYAASCGGYTEDNEIVWQSDANPALRARLDARSLGDGLFAQGLTEKSFAAFLRHPPSLYCAPTSPSQAGHFRWQKHLEGSELNTKLANYHAQLGGVTKLVMGRRGRGGRLTQVTLVGKHGQTVVGPELAIRKLFGNLPSAAFLATTQTDRRGLVSAISFEGAGWGHGVGLCQTGAMGRAHAGHDVRQILAFYYAGARIENLWPTRS